MNNFYSIQPGIRDKNYPVRHRLWIQVVVSFLLFLSVGTIGLIFVLNLAFQRLSHAEFEALAKSNAEFIRTLHFPLTPELAGYFSRIVGAEARFGRVNAPDERHEAVTVAIEPGAELTLIRERPTLIKSLMRPVSIGALAAFWILWFVLAWAVLRSYLRIQRLALLGQMTTSLAHEIRNPIAAIRLHAQLLQQHEPTTAPLIIGQANTIERLLNQWMFLARPEPPRKTEVNINALLQESVKVLAPAAEHAGVRIVVDANDAQCVKADGIRLAQAFHNIILNAIQAMSDGGTLSISAGQNFINFADTGPGFSSLALKRWADPLFSEKEGGMGVGLTVAREIIQGHGGDIIVSNRHQGGALVQIQLWK